MSVATKQRDQTLGANNAVVLPAGYKRTEVGVIPFDWMPTPIRDIAPLQRGFDLPTSHIRPGPHPVVYSNGVLQHHEQAMVKGPGVVTGRSGTIGSVHFIERAYWPHNTALWVTSFRGNDPRFVYYLYTHIGFARFLAGSGVPTLNRNDVHQHVVACPRPVEQRAIAEALSAVDGLLGALDALIAKKRAIRQGAMQQLLTGRTRLPGFSGEWRRKTIAEVASPCSERNSLGADLPVLTCSKHLGFVDSLKYFKSQVFSRDLRGYKIIRQGEIGYPANHIEEGSIGLQDLYGVALVSPIYVVCSPKDGVNSYFLHRLLKLDSYRQEFATATTSSVDRRGSLRWPAFSRISVTLPLVEEQIAVVTVLSDMDAEIAALERRRDKTRGIKQGMMQQLLTGRVRLVKPPHEETVA